MQLEERIKFEEWLKQNNWIWVVGMMVFINPNNEKKLYSELLETFKNEKK